MNTKQRIDELEAELISELEKQKTRVTQALADARLQLAASKPTYDGIARSVDECKCVIHSKIFELNGSGVPDFDLYTFFSSREAAKRELKTSQLIRDAKIAMMADWGDVKCEWGDDTQCKYVIIISGNAIKLETFTYSYQFLAFRTREARDYFFESRDVEELILIITNGMGL